MKANRNYLLDCISLFAKAVNIAKAICTILEWLQ